MPGDLILGVETSCDETSVALLEAGRIIRSNLIASQVDLHREYGGVVPELACRRHVETLNPLLAEALKAAGATWADVGAVAVTHCPGLAGALLVGVAAAKMAAVILGIPLVGVNHLHGHIYANFLEDPDLQFPFLALLVSGGHTMLTLVRDHGAYETLGETRDDAAGEAFDKIGRALALGYPGGPVIDRLAAQGNPKAVDFPRPARYTHDLDFSFSGLKTAVVNFLRSPKARQVSTEDVCASVQQAIVDVLVEKTLLAARERGVRRVVLAGGVAANRQLRRDLAGRAAAEGIEVRAPSPALCTDNAAMIACNGYYLLRAGIRHDPGTLDVFPNERDGSIDRSLITM